MCGTRIQNGCSPGCGLRWKWDAPRQFNVPILNPSPPPKADRAGPVCGVQARARPPRPATTTTASSGTINSTASGAARIAAFFIAEDLPRHERQHGRHHGRQHGG
ncbi:MAG: hypothetical protein ACRDND_32300, partial [Streptosporangiaceae bacterium]